MHICLILPTYNEAPNLERLVTAVRALGLGLEILIVDDASPDRTGQIAEGLALGHRDLGVLCRTGPRSYGEALTDGFGTALSRGAEVILTMDADFSHDPAAIPQLLAALHEADLAIGSRYIEGGELRAWPLYRRLLSASANAFVQLLFNLPTHDCTSGFRAYRRVVLESIPWTELHSVGYSYLVEILYWAVRGQGARVVEVPICFAERQAGKSKMGFRHIVDGAFYLLWLRARLLSTRFGRAAPS